MPRITTPDGLTRYVPGVYMATEVVNDLPGPLPEFHVPVIVGGANQGHPYDADDTAYDHENKPGAFRLISSTAEAEAYYGKGSAIATAFKYAKRHGLPFAYCVAINPLTRAEATVKSGAGAVDELDLYAKSHGPVGGWHKVAIGAGNAVTITPVAAYALLTANAASGDVRVYVQHNAWASAGQTVEIGANGSVNATLVIAETGEEFDANGQRRYWIEFTAALAANYTTAAYGLVALYATQAEESGALVNGQAVFDWINDRSQYIGAAKAGTFSNANLDAVVTAPLRSLSGATAGTSPAPSSTEHDDFIGDLDASEWDAFLLRYGRVPQAFLIVDSSATIHAAWRDWAAAKRTLGEPVSITVGCAWGDVVVGAGDATDPAYRARQLNSQDVMLVANGAEELGSYLTRAPAVFGRRVGGGLNHNLTNDEYLFASDEVRWNERGAQELTTLTRAGVVTTRLRVGRGSPRMVVSQGLSTLQANDSAWNTGTNDTCLVHQRDLADFFDRVMSEDLDGTQVGADGADRDSVSATLVARANRSLRRKGYITSYRLVSVELDASGAGWNVTHTASFPTTTDYITVQTRVLIGG